MSSPLADESWELILEFISEMNWVKGLSAYWARYLRICSLFGLMPSLSNQLFCWWCSPQFWFSISFSVFSFPTQFFSRTWMWSYVLSGLMKSFADGRLTSGWISLISLKWGSWGTDGSYWGIGYKFWSSSLSLRALSAYEIGPVIVCYFSYEPRPVDFSPVTSTVELRMLSKPLLDCKPRRPFYPGQNGDSKNC